VGAIWFPESPAGFLHHWRAHPGEVELTQTGVDNWQDPIGGLVAAQPIASQRPAWVNDSINGLPSVRFEGGWLPVSSAPTPGGELAAIVVAKYNQVSTTNFVFAASGDGVPLSNRFYFLSAGGEFIFSAGPDSEQKQIRSAADTEWHIFDLAVSAGVMTARIDGAVIGTEPQSTTAPLNIRGIGALNDSFLGHNNVAEVVVCAPAYLDSAYAMLALKYGFAKPGDATFPDGIPAIESTARQLNGNPVDRVLVRETNSGRNAGMARPDATGYWYATLPPGTYDVSYFATGCAPVVHGPYIIE